MPLFEAGPRAWFHRVAGATLPSSALAAAARRSPRAARLMAGTPMISAGGEGSWQAGGATSRTGRRVPLRNTAVAGYHGDVKFTAVYLKVPEGHVAFAEELPGANTQGVTLKEARANLREAVALVLDANRVLAKEAVRGRRVKREPLSLRRSR
jgi:predicted RNase H-like HicB family nuclease